MHRTHRDSRRPSGVDRNGFALCAWVTVMLAACGGGDTSAGTNADGASVAHGDAGAPGSGSDGGASNLDTGAALGADGNTAHSDGSTSHPPADAGTNPVGDSGTPVADSGGPGRATDGGYPAGWLFTSGGKIYVSHGNSGSSQWMGRGVNLDDIFFCGLNNGLSMASPDQTLEMVISGLMSGWKPTFVRISLAMDSYGGTVASWLSNPPQYKTPMTNVINTLGTYSNLYTLLTLRSDASMILQDTTHGDPEATGIPSDSTTTPNAGKYPTGTDATYVALVDSFASASFVIFGLTNEPGGNQRSDATIAAAMNHAVGTIRAEEDRLGVPHHIVSVQGNNWTSSIGYYVSNPISHDNVVYEVHGYPPSTSSYTDPSIPVIIGEYGSLDSSSAPAFYADVEAKQIPNLAWDFDSYNNCAPDLLNVNHSATNLSPTAWGMIVQSYLLAH
jgi:hypothetical protein